MSQVFRECPDCGGERPFEQFHDEPGRCPDSLDGNCPEWCCGECGAALLDHLPSGRAGRAMATALARRVA